MKHKTNLCHALAFLRTRLLFGPSNFPDPFGLVGLPNFSSLIPYYFVYNIFAQRLPEN